MKKLTFCPAFCPRSYHLEMNIFSLRYLTFTFPQVECIFENISLLESKQHIISARIACLSVDSL